jgi:tetratricopeptide (TPR) repeat protein
LKMGKRKKQLRNISNTDGLIELIGKADESFKLGDFKKAISICKKTDDIFDLNISDEFFARIYFVWVLSLMKLEDYDSIDYVINRAEQKLGRYLDLVFMRAMTAFGKGDFKKALIEIDEYEKLRSNTEPHSKSYLKQSYNSLDEVLWLGSEAAGKVLDIDKVLDYMERSLALKPGNHSHRVELASLLAKQNQDSKAITIIDDGIKRYPDIRALKNARGFILGELEQYQEAEKYIKDLLRENPRDTDSLNNLGVIYDKQGLYDKAKELFKQVLEIEPDNLNARNNLIYLNDHIDDKPQTISLCMIVKNEEKFLPDCLKTVEGLVDEIIIVDTGSTDRTMEIAREYKAKIYEHPWQNDFSLHRNQSISYATCDWILILDADEELDPTEHNIIRMAIKRKDIDSVSFVVFNKIQHGRIGFLNSHRMFRRNKGFKYHGIVHNQLEVTGKTLISQFKVIHHGYGLSSEQMEKKGRRSEALLLKQLEESPQAIFPHFNLAQLYRGLGEPQKSLEHASIVAERIGPDDLDRRHVFLMSLDQIGCAHIGLEQLDEAEKTFKEALEYKNDYLDPMFNLGFMYMRQKRYQDAEEIFLRYLKTREDYSPNREYMGLILNNLESQFAVYYSLGFIAFLRNETEPALEYFHKSLEQTDDFEYLHHLLSRCYRRKGMFYKVLEHCVKAVEFGHEDAEIRLIEGESYLNLGNAKSARKSFNRALELRPDFEDARLGLLGADSLERTPEELLEHVNQFLEKSPSSPQGLAARGDVLFKLGDYNQALSSYKDSASKYPDDYKVLNNLGNCFLKQKNYASAEFYYLSALQKNKEFLPGYRNLAVVLIYLGRMSDAAEYLDYYLYKNPDDAEVHATLGDIYYNNKSYDKSIIHFEKYLLFYPDSLDALIRLSDCYFNSGKLQAAALGYQAVVSKDPANKTAKQKLDDLKGFLKPIIVQ